MRRLSVVAVFVVLFLVFIVSAAWALDYNTRRPHSPIGYLTPEAFAASLTATG